MLLLSFTLRRQYGEPRGPSAGREQPPACAGDCCSGFGKPPISRSGASIPPDFVLTMVLAQAKAATLRNDQRAGAVLGEELEQHGVRRLAVEDDDALDAALDRLDAGLDLGDHAAGDRAVGDQRLGLARRSARRSASCPCRARPARRSGTAGAWRRARRRWRRRTCRR